MWRNRLAFTLGWIFFTFHFSFGQLSFLKDIDPQPDSTYSGSPQEITGFGSNVYFTYNDPLSGRELWQSDGTRQGTRLVLDILPGTSSSNATKFIATSNRLYFTADDGSHGRELWMTDGTTVGTRLLKDINPGLSQSSIGSIFTWGSILLFSALDPVNGQELWRTDGTDAGTYLIKDINPGTSPSGPQFMGVINGVVYMMATDNVRGRELWRTDGTAAGTYIVKDMQSGSSGSLVFDWAVVTDKLYFTREMSNGTDELWRSDGSASGTFRVNNYVIGTNYNFTNLTGGASKLYFTAVVPATNKVEAIFKTDGFSNDWVENFFGSVDPFFQMQAVEGKLFYTVLHGSSNNQSVEGRIYDEQRGRYDYVGTWDMSTYYDVTHVPFGFFKGSANVYYSISGDPSMVMRKDPGNLHFQNIYQSYPNFFFCGEFKFYQDKIYTVADWLNGHGYELYVSNGSDGSLTQLTNSRGGNRSSQPDGFTPLQNELVFNVAYGGGSYRGNMWKSDGTAAGTVPLKDSTAVKTSGEVMLNGQAFFSGYLQGSGTELWKTDGTSTGTSIVKDLNPGYSGSSPTNITLFNNKVVFTAGAPPLGYALYESDGTTAGTKVIVDLRPGDSNINGDAKLLGKTTSYIFYAWNGGAAGSGIWKSDGTAAGTTLVKAIALRANAKVVDEILYFEAITPESGAELWRTDGTASGTFLVKEINAGAASADPRNITPFGSKLLFTSSSNSLWVTDGTEVGTQRLKDFPAATSTIVNAGGYAYFFADKKLFVTDGTSGGTREIIELAQAPQRLSCFNNELFFITLSSGSKYALWHSDGTAAGTAAFDGMYVTATPPIAAVQQTVFIQAGDDKGLELWKYQQNRTSQQISFADLEDKKFGDPSFFLTATSDAGLPVRFVSSNPSVAKIVDNEVIIVGGGKATITAMQDGNYEFASASPIARELNVAKIDQTITFDELPTRLYTDRSFILEGLSTAGLQLSYTSSDPSIVSISGNEITIHKTGTVTITALQPGDSNYLEAPAVTRTLTIEKGTQRIEFPKISEKSFGDPSSELLATATSGLPAVFTISDLSIASVAGNTLQIHKPGVVTITASQAGDDNFYPAPDSLQTITISKGLQEISFGTLPAKHFGDAPFLLEATTTSGLQVNYTSSDPSIASINGSEIQIHRAGNIMITASQSGDDNYFAAADSLQELNISKASQAISFSSLQGKSLGDPVFSLTASSTSGLQVLFTSSDPSIASINGDEIVIHNAGEVTITASQQGDDNFFAAADFNQTLTISKASQEITFSTLNERTFNDLPFSLTAASTSGLPLVFTSLDPTIASIDGDVVTIHKSGEVAIIASQSGDDNYMAAEMTQTLTISKASQSILFNTIEEKKFGDLPFAVYAITTSDLPLFFISSDPTIASVSGDILHIHKSGLVTITASQPGDENYLEAPAVSQNLIINKATQEIVFGPIPYKSFGDPLFTVDATATTGLPLTFTSSDPDVAEISGDKILIQKTGEVFITAHQSGDDRYFMAEPVTQKLTIQKANQYITLGGIEDKRVDEGPFAIEASATSSLPIRFTVSGSSIRVQDGIVEILTAGVSVITAHQDGDDNFNAAESVSTTVAIGKIQQAIEFESISEKKVGDDPFNINVTASSGLQVTVDVYPSGVISLDGNTVTILASGTVTLEAKQSGNDYYEEASTVLQVIVIARDETADQIQLHPNPTTGDLVIFSTDGPVNSAIVMDSMGKSEPISVLDNHIDISHLSPGIYFIKLNTSLGSTLIKVIKE